MTRGRLRMVRDKRQTGQEAGAELNVNTNALLDLVITGAVSAVVSVAVNRAMK